MDGVFTTKRRYLASLHLRGLQVVGFDHLDNKYEDFKEGIVEYIV
jgi:hypothetical protein